MNKEILLQRYSDDSDSTQGLWFCKQIFFCHTMEDEHRDKKVKGETRIPAGVYKLGIQELLTPMTKRYQAKYDWFEKHIEVKNVPDFTGIYIHIGNDDDDTMGCLLLNDSAKNNQIEKGFNARSTQAYKRFYEQYYPRLKAGEEIYIEIRDEHELF